MCGKSARRLLATKEADKPCALQCHVYPERIRSVELLAQLFVFRHKKSGGVGRLIPLVTTEPDK